jgi:Domain of unknown function (DUF4157)
VPWPFRKRKEATAGAAAPTSMAAASGPAPITAADFAPRRLAVPVPRAWAALPPMATTVTSPSSSLVAPQASFVTDVAGTQSLIQVPVLRHVSADGPAGRADDIVAAGRDLTSGRPSPAANMPGASPGAHDVPRSAPRSLQGRTRPTGPRGRLDAYEGELRPYEPPEPSYAGWDPEAWADEPVGADDEGGIPEELPPPIFSTILAERTGRSLAELRPDLADEHGNIIEPEAPAAPQPGAPRRRISPAEMKRMGLGAPQHSDAAAKAQPGDEAVPAPPTPPAPADEADDEVEFVEAEVTLEEFFGAEPAAPPPAPEIEPEPEPETRSRRGPGLRFRAAPGAPVRRMPEGPDAVPLRQSVPTDVREAVARATGVDPGPATVHRGPVASVEATRIGASAFTRDGEIFLPAEHGPLDGPATRAIVAHELTHVVQHRVYGDRLPRPDSIPGRRLEAEARAVQRWVAGVDDAPRVPPTGTAGTTPAGSNLAELRQTADELVRSGLAHWAPDGTLVFGGGAIGGLGEPWRVVPDDIHEAWEQDRELYNKYDEARQSGSDTTEALNTWVEYHREFEEHFGEQLQNMTTGTGPTGTTGRTGTGTAKTAEQLDKELKDLEKKHTDAEAARHGEAATLGWSLFGHPEDAKSPQKEASLGFGGFFDHPDAVASQAALQKHREKEKANQDKIEAAKKKLEDAKAGRTTATTSTPGTTPLIHAPGGQGEGTGAGQDGTATTHAMTESERLQATMKAQEELWKLEDEEAKLEAGRPQDVSNDFDEAHAGGLFGSTARAGGGGIGGFFSGLFGNPDQAAQEAKQKADEEEYEKQHAQLVERRDAQRAIEAAQAREGGQQAQTQGEGQAQPGGETPGTGVAVPAGEGGAGGPTPDASSTHEVNQTARQEALSQGLATVESQGAGQAVLAQLADEDVEDLANLLYNRLIIRLRRDLIVDRERAGLLTDFR